MTARSWALALVLAASAPVLAETAQQHVKAAQAAEKRSDWRKALREWQAAYRLEINAEYLISIGDAFAHLGNKAEARKQYEAYLADPLTLPANATRVKAKIAALGTPPAAKESGMALALPEVAKAGETAAAAPLPLPGLDAPALPNAADAGKKPAGAPAAGAAAVAAATPPAAAKPAAEKPPPAPASAKAPSEAVAAAETAHPTPTSRGGVQRTMAWVAAGVAVAAFAGGAIAYGQASSAQNDLTGGVHSGAQAQSLLEREKSNKTLSAVAFAGGLVAAGMAVALFTF